jgi:hypothetical protein
LPPDGSIDQRPSNLEPARQRSVHGAFVGDLEQTSTLLEGKVTDEADIAAHAVDAIRLVQEADRAG